MVECDCPGYVQKHSSMKIFLQGKPIRHDNNPEFLVCLRCGHEAYRHQSARHPSQRVPAGKRAQGVEHDDGSTAAPSPSPAPAPAATQQYTPAGARGGLNSGYYYASVPSTKPSSEGEGTVV